MVGAKHKFALAGVSGQDYGAGLGYGLNGNLTGTYDGRRPDIWRVLW